ncbi:hypothetical protein D3C86_1565760 [compost metagenome]
MRQHVSGSWPGLEVVSAKQVEHELVDARVHAGTDLGGQLRRTATSCARGLRPIEGQLVGEELIEQDAERVHVRRGIKVVVRDIRKFRRQVGLVGTALGVGEHRAAGVHPRTVEIGEARLAVEADKYRGRADVAVDDVSCMNRFERGSNPFGDFQSFTDREPLSLGVGEEAMQRSVLRPLGDLEELVVFVDVVELEHGEQVRVAADTSDSLGGATHDGLALLDLLVTSVGIDLPGSDAVA